MDDNSNTIIESLGVYVPPMSFTTDEILENCKTPIRFPLEKISGIKSRAMAGQEEFSLDIAKKAVADCLAQSKYQAEEIDLLICCNISRYDAPDSVSFEPSTSIKLKKHFGFSEAIVFDITNACAGMFTGVYIANALLNSGAIQRGLVVSGEYITHLTQTAQKEIESFMDTRLACLTLGDAGAALILEKGPDRKTGFHEIALQTFGQYSPYCIAKVSEQGGWIMHTDSVNLADVAIKSGAQYALNVLQEAGWPPDQFQHLIMHQTSRMTMNSARREINQLLNSNICHDGNTINNLEQRGNTASTSHFVAIADQIRNGNIQSGDKVVFSISASGLTVGTALYVFDDLPDRLGQPAAPLKDLMVDSAQAYQRSKDNDIRLGISVESVGTVPLLGSPKLDSMASLELAANNCLEKSEYECNDIELLIYCGVYRNDYLLEPAYAALLAGKLGMNASISEPESKKTLAFDIFNGAVGFLNACFVAQQMILAGNCQTAMIVASECENNATRFPDNLMGIRETASAIILDAHPKSDKGFSRFMFDAKVTSIDAYVSSCSTREIHPRLQIEKASDLEDRYISCIVPVVKAFLQEQRLDFTQIKKVFPPQISSEFIKRLGEQLHIPQENFVEVVGEGPDMFTSSFPYGIEYARENELLEAGDIGLVITVGSGIQVGCAIYHF